MTFGGVRFIHNDHLVDGPFEDWSQVRSPGRALRRRKMGHAQRVRIYYLPSKKLLKLPDGTIVGHSATLHELAREVDRQKDLPVKPRSLLLDERS